MIGAYCTISYIGTMDNMSGYMESGFSVERFEGDKINVID